MTNPTKKVVDKLDWDAVAVTIMELELELAAFRPHFNKHEIQEYLKLIAMYESIKQKMIHQSPRQYQVMAPVDFLDTEPLDDFLGE